MALVSIITPTYNRADYLKITVDSVLAQTFKDFELIVVDNASTDDTPELMASYMAHDARVRYIRKPVNTGLINSYNLGWQNARSEFIHFLDSDDVVSPHATATQVAVFWQHPEVDVVIHRKAMIDENGRVLRVIPRLPTNDLLDRALATNLAVLGQALFRRRALAAIGGFDESLAYIPDLDCWVRLLLNGAQFKMCQQPIFFYYRTHTGNTTWHASREERDFRAMLDKSCSDPRMPADLVAKKPVYLAGYELGWTGGYARAGQFDDARRTLEEATRLNPDLCNPKGWAKEILVDVSLDKRCADPVKFIEWIVENLPDGLLWVKAHRPYLLAGAQVGIAFRHLRLDEVDEYQHHIRAALEAYPLMAQQGHPFIGRLSVEAFWSASLEPIDFVQYAMAKLPNEASGLRRWRRKLLKNAYLDIAYSAYGSGDTRLVPRWIISALASHPPAARRPEVWTTFINSVINNAKHLLSAYLPI